jgi:hypothetical protein
VSLHNVDVAAALYREEPVALYYLDHDPQAAARYALGAHLGLGQLAMLAALSNAWHRFNPHYLPIDEKCAYAPLFTRRTPVARARHAVAQEDPADPFYEERSGDPTYWMLMGQKIAMPRAEDHPNSLWVRASAANYRWAHAYGVALAHEFQYRHGYLPGTLPQLWTLESLPPDLLGCTQPQTAPTPIVPEDSVVLDADGCYDTVESYRTYYRRHKRAIHNWQSRGAPAWLEDPGGP